MGVLKINLIGVLLLFLSFFSVNAQDSQGKIYAAGEIQSKETSSYGRYEMLMYSSDVSGTTSTFFLWREGGYLATVKWNEIDIETFGQDGGRWQSNPIWEYTDTDTNTKRWEGDHEEFQIANNWVKFALEWTPSYIAWFANDVEVRRILLDEDVPVGHHRYPASNPVNNIIDPMEMCFNHWCQNGNWLGSIGVDSFPSYQFVDWLTYQPWSGNGFGEISYRADFSTLAEVQEDFDISAHTFDDNHATFTPDNVGVTDEGYLWLGITYWGEGRVPLTNELPPVPED